MCDNKITYPPEFTDDDFTDDKRTANTKLAQGILDAATRIVAHARRGPADFIFITNRDQFNAIYGKLNTDT